MKAMVDEAARAQRIIGAHCHGKPGIMAALRSGVKTIEHGSYIDEECADLMLEKGATLVATRLIIANGLTLGEKYMAPYAWEKLKALADSHWRAMQTAIHKGVKIAIGPTRLAPHREANCLDSIVSVRNCTIM
jgi:imidazolonepropionase-like amidohydrolase